MRILCGFWSRKLNYFLNIPRTISFSYILKLILCLTLLFCFVNKISAESVHCTYEGVLKYVVYIQNSYV